MRTTSVLSGGWSAGPPGPVAAACLCVHGCEWVLCSRLEGNLSVGVRKWAVRESAADATTLYMRDAQASPRAVATRRHVGWQRVRVASQLQPRARAPVSTVATSSFSAILLSSLPVAIFATWLLSRRCRRRLASHPFDAHVLVRLDGRLHALPRPPHTSAERVLVDFLADHAQRAKLRLGAVFDGTAYAADAEGVMRPVSLPRLLTTATPAHGCAAASRGRALAATLRLALARPIVDLTSNIGESALQSVSIIREALQEARPETLLLVRATAVHTSTFLALQCSLLASVQIRELCSAPGSLLLDACDAILFAQACILPIFVETPLSVVLRALALRETARDGGLGTWGPDGTCCICMDALEGALHTCCCPCLTTLHMECARSCFAREARCPVCRRFASM